MLWKKIRIPPPPSTISSLDKVSLDMNFSCHFHIFFSTKFWKQKLNLGKNLTIPAVLTLRLRLQGLRALGGENLGEHLTFIGQRWTFARSLAGALSRGVLNVIVIDLVLCGELKVPNLLDLQGRLSIRWRKLGWTFYFHCTDMTL